MRTRYLMIIGLYFLGFGTAAGQNITGILLNSVTEEPVAFVGIEVQGTKEGGQSNEDGSFSLTVEQFPVRLIFTALDFHTKELVVEQQVERLVVYLDPQLESLSEVVLRSTIIPNSLQQTPYSVSVLTSQDFERFDQTSIMKSVNTVPGVFVHQGALNTNKLSIRGVGARSQYSTNRVKAYFEGIPISTAEGETTLDDIDQDVVERVEIIKGPTSSVYGAGLGGVINLYAARAHPDRSKTTAETSFGSFGMRKSTLKTTHASETAGIYAAYNHLSTDSFRENGTYDRKSITLHGTINDSSLGDLAVLANFTRLMAYIPSSLNQEQFENEPSSAAYTWMASQGYESYEKGLLGLSYQHDLSPGLQNTTSIYMNFRDALEPRPFDVLKEEQVAAGARTKINYQHQAWGQSAEFSAGAEFYREWYDTATFENLYESFPGEGSIPGTILSNNDQDRIYYNIFSQWNLALTPELKVETGFNLNSTRYELADMFYRDEIDQSGEYQFETIVSPRIGAAYDLAEGKTLYTSISHGFSTPTVAETLTPEGLINTELKPEQGINYELGFKGNWMQNRWYTEMAFFSIQVSDLLMAERVGEDQYIGRNAGRTDHNGVEVFTTYTVKLNPRLQARAYVNASLNFYEFDEFLEGDMNLSGNRIPGFPERTVNGGLDLISSTGFSFYASAEHVGENPLNDSNSQFNDSYNLVHLKASYEVSFSENLHVNVHTGVNNLLDEHYASSILPNAVGFGGALPRYFYPGNPRNFYGGIALSYKLW